jgi:hypothetical protein
VGFKRFLSRGESAETDAEDPLERLAELGRETGSPAAGGYSGAPFAQLATLDEAAEKKSARQQEKRERPDARNFAVWKRQQSPGIAGLFDRRF